MSNKPTKRRKTQNIAISSVSDDFDTVKFNQPHRVSAGGYKGTANKVHPLGIDAETWENMFSWKPAESADFALCPDSGSFDDALDTEVMDSDPTSSIPAPQPNRAPRIRSTVSTRPNVVWRDQYRETFLDELCRWDGRGDFWMATKCPECAASGKGVEGHALFRCQSCFVPELLCNACTIQRHKNQPLHRIQQWNGTYFVDVSLKSMGLRVQLNHLSPSSTCPVPRTCHVNLIVLHTNGIHEVAFDYCGCSRSVPDYIQLLRRRIYPASQQVIKTCASFELLELFHKIALTTKASTHDLYEAINKLTDSTGLFIPKSKYKPLIRMIQQWRHSKMMKYAGRALHPSGIKGAKPGDAALRCLSCARPGVNLPPNWRDAPEDKRYLYRAFLGMDANFRLKNQAVSNHTQSPALGAGLSYMVPREDYEKYQLVKANESDISTCVGFQAIAQANTRSSRGLRYTGVAGVFCGRSEMLLPLGMGNLQKGERYSNMDYVFASAMKEYQDLPVVLISYDICCQWFKNLKSRLSHEDWPAELRLPDNQTLIPAIPKLHKPMHHGKNHQQFSLNFIPGVGLSSPSC
ncbi:hypothetical protein CVT24_007540 [Panaeolus cyanescens]|uniref:CxC2-like cysteine cluster KDZ transposase-associated domain-containing protein n=1 Tax=Panaeolus cyanescens TaxID=181874 RepID=A0A409WLA2_9AGAR|nr:hypothetical protein CVT24_007540 [Panaeolus cyanescens]